MATFVALQCYQCSTMQVKQQKHKSNKWSCAICNEKQSVRKVFARSGLARDIRKFVQDFNMGRQAVEAQALQEIEAEEEKALYELQEEAKQSKWAEYLTTEEGEFMDPLPISDACDNVTVVTALPDAPSGKRRQRASSIESPHCSDRIHPKLGKIHRRTTLEGFGFVRANKDDSGVAGKTLTRELKMPQTIGSECGAKLAGLVSQSKKPRYEVREAAVQDAGDNVKLISKWAAYMDAENETHGSEDWAHGGNGSGLQGLLKAELTDQVVDEEVHPDFL